MYICKGQKRKIQKIKKRKNSEKKSIDTKSYINEKNNDINTDKKNIEKIKKNNDIYKKKERNEKYNNILYDNYSYVVDKNNRNKNILQNFDLVFQSEDFIFTSEEEE